jgi:hypothetical protein
MNIDDKYVDEMIDLVENALFKLNGTQRYDMEKDQPKHFSWFHVWWSTDHLASDYCSGLEYADAEEFQQVLIESVRNVFNTTTLQYISDGKIKDFGMQIGPEQPSGGDLNNELGLGVNYGQ